MVTFTTSRNENDLQGILKLQRSNLPGNLSHEEIASQGFVTVVHTYEQLRKMNDLENHVIAKQEDEVVGYLLAMTEASQEEIPVLRSMFREFNNTVYDQKKISEYKYIVVGQVCLAKDFRGQGILDSFYQYYREHFQIKYEMAITEIDIANQRSLKAHKRIGFVEAKTYKSPDGTEWVIVLWDWRP